MLVLVGLGNPGTQYKNTRHNFGWLILDALIDKYAPGANWQQDVSTRNLSAIVTVNSTKLKLTKPQTYMNQSGESVNELLHFYHLQPSDLIIIHDDIDLPLGTLRFSNDASSGGHQGVDNIIKLLGTQSLNRLRLGVGKPTDQTPIEQYVLQTWNQTDEALVKIITTEAVNILIQITNSLIPLNPFTKKITI